MSIIRGCWKRIHILCGSIVDHQGDSIMLNRLLTFVHDLMVSSPLITELNRLNSIGIRWSMIFLAIWCLLDLATITNWTTREFGEMCKMMAHRYVSRSRNSII